LRIADRSEASALAAEDAKIFIWYGISSRLPFPHVTVNSNA
jgi:hypothetical protein